MLIFLMVLGLLFSIGDEWLTFKIVKCGGRELNWLINKIGLKYLGIAKGAGFVIVTIIFLLIKKSNPGTAIYLWVGFDLILLSTLVWNTIQYFKIPKCCRG